MPNDPRFTTSVVSGTSFGDVGDLVVLSTTHLLANFDTFSGSTINMYFTVSTDGGLTWTPTLVDSTNGNNGAFQNYSMVSLDGVTIYIFYSLFNFSSPNDFIEVRMAKSTNGGVSWVVSDVSTTQGNYNGRAFMDTGHIFLPIGLNDLPGTLSAFVSVDGGGTWTPHVIDSNGVPGRIIGRGNVLLTAYNDFSTFTVLRFAFSTDCGVTWTPSTVDTSTQQVDAVTLDSLDGNTVWVFYQVGTASFPTTYGTASGLGGFVSAKTTNRGGSWTFSLVDALGNGGATPGTPIAFVANASEPTVCYGSPEWVPGTDGYSPSLKFAQSTDGGSTWTTSFIQEGFQSGSDEVFFGAGPGGYSAFNPSHFFALGIVGGSNSFGGNPNFGNINLYSSNTGITGTFTAPTAFTCAAGPPVVHGAVTSAGIVSGAKTSAGVVSGAVTV